MLLSLALAASAFAAKRIEYSRAQLSDFEITALPGAPAVPFKQFGGYVDVGARGKITLRSVALVEKAAPLVQEVVDGLQRGHRVAPRGIFLRARRRGGAAAAAAAVVAVPGSLAAAASPCSFFFAAVTALLPRG